MFEDTRQIFQIGSKVVRIDKVKNFEELITDPSDPDQVPCWAEIWPAAVGLAHYLEACDWLSGCSVIELGAGLGLPGIVAGLNGAGVTFSDFHRLSLDYCSKNAELNGLKDYTTLFADWRDFPENRYYDVLLGADIVYEPRLLPYLEKIIKNYVRRGSLIILSHASRKVTFSFIEKLSTEERINNKEEYIQVEIEDSLFNSYRIAVHLITGAK